MKKNLKKKKKENIKDNHASRREFIGKTEEEYLTSKCILELMEHIADSAGGQGAPKHVLLLPEVAFFSKELANRLSITPLQAVLLRGRCITSRLLCTKNWPCYGFILWREIRDRKALPRRL